MYDVKETLEIEREGFNRSMDKEGRVTLPVEMRERFGFTPGSLVDIYQTNAGVLICNPKSK